MKIAIINSVLYGSTGAIAQGTARLLPSRQAEALLFYGRGGGKATVPARRFESEAEFRLHVLEARLTDRQGFFSRRATERLVSQLKEYQPDVVHLHQPHGYYLHLPMLFAYFRSCGLPIVWTLHDCWSFTGHCAYFDYARCEKWKTGCGKCPQRTGYPSSLVDRSAQNLKDKIRVFSDVPNLTIAVPSKWLEGLVMQSFLKQYPVFVIPNGIDTQVFRPVESDLRKRYGIGEDRLLLGVANVWEPRKGLPYIIELGKRLPKGWRLAVVGLQRGQIERLPEGILGLGRTRDARELAQWYSAADVFINPTLEDNFPTTHMEALACGTPVVSFDVGGCGEMLTPACGVLVTPGDVEGLLNGAAKAMQMRRDACLAASCAFDQQRRLAAYADLYTALREGNRI